MITLLGIIYNTRLSAQTDSLMIDDVPRDGITKLNSIYSCQRQIITAEQIKLSGYNRLSDVLQLTVASHFAPVNYEQLNLRVNGSSTYSNQNWILMVNGQRVLNYLPPADVLSSIGISVNEIERIEIVNTPIQYLGEYADYGIIHIITKNTGTGFHARTYVSHMLNQGDQLPNKGTAGLINFNQHLGYSTNKFQVNFQFGMIGSNSSPSWPASPTVFDFKNHYRENLFNSRIQVNYVSGKWMHQWQANTTLKNSTSSLNYYGKKVSDYKPTQLDYLIQYNLNPTHHFRVGASYSITGNNYYSEDNRFGLNFYHEYRKPRKKDFIRIKTGARIAFTESRTNFSNRFSEQLVYLMLVFDTSFSYLTYHPFTSISVPLTRKAWLTTDINGSFSNLNSSVYAPGYDLTLTLYKRISILSNWSLVFSMGNKSGVFNNNLFNRIDKVNMPFPSMSTIAYGKLMQNGKSAENNRMSFTGNYAMNIGNNFKLFLTTGFYKETNSLLDQNFSDLTPRLSIYNYHTSTYTSLYWINRFNIHYDVMKNVFMDLNIMRTSPFNQTNTLTKNIPLYKSTLIINYLLPYKINWWTKFYYQSATEWILGEGLPLGYGYGTIAPSSSLTNQFFTEVAFTKDVFKDKITLQLSGKNITKSITGSEQYTPYGYSFPLRIMAAVSYRFD